MAATAAYAIPQMGINTKTLLETGIAATFVVVLALMDVKYRNLGGATMNSAVLVRQSLPELLGLFCSLAVVLIACSPARVAELMLEDRSRVFWPRFGHPDTLIALQGLVRLCVLFIAGWRVRSQRTSLVSATYLHFMVVAFTLRCMVHFNEGFEIGGGCGGQIYRCICVALPLSALILTVFQRKTELEANRLHLGPFLAVLLVIGYLGIVHRLALDTDPLINAMFTWMCLLEFAGMCHHLAFSLQIGSRSGLKNLPQAHGLLLLLVIEQLAATYHLLDSFGLLPRTTLEVMGDRVTDWDQTVEAGNPVGLVIVAQLSGLVCAGLSAAFFFVRQGLLEQERLASAALFPQANQVPQLSAAVVF